MIENPQPAWLSLLLFALPGITFAAFAINEAVFSQTNRPLCTVPAIGIVLALMPTHLLALAFGSLTVGLSGAWVAVAVAGYLWAAWRGRRFRGAIAVDGAGRTRLGIAFLATIPIVLPTILFNFFDEVSFNGHLAIIAHLQNGTYPPRYLYEPNLLLRYHYAFDLAAAIVTALTQVRLDHAVDLLTVGLWPCMFLLLWRVGEHFGGKRAGLFVAFTVSFSAGLCSFCPIFVNFYFQHPWSIGTPIFCLVILQHAALRQSPHQMLSLVAFICSLSFLALCQAVLFVTTVAALGVAEAWRAVRYCDRYAVSMLILICVAVLFAKLMGGFFVSAAYPVADGLFGTAFFVRDFSSLRDLFDQARWNVDLVGLLLVPGIIGLLRARRDRVFLATLAVLGFFAVNLFHYKYTDDIFKFVIVSFIALAIGAGVLLSDVRQWAITPIRRLILGCLIIALLWKGIFFYLFTLLVYDSAPRSPFSVQMIKPYLSTAYPVAQDEARAISFLRTRLGPSDIVYRAKDKLEPYAIWAGLPTQASVYTADSGDDDAYGLGAKKFAARESLSSISGSWLDRLGAEHVTWVVTDPTDVAINLTLECPEGRSRAILAAQFGQIKAFRLQ